MPKDKKQVTQTTVRKAISLYEQALHLQRAMYDFKDTLADLGLEYEGEQIGNGAFEMDLTWNNAKEVANSLIRKYKSESKDVDAPWFFYER